MDSPSSTNSVLKAREEALQSPIETTSKRPPSHILLKALLLSSPTPLSFTVHPSQTSYSFLIFQIFSHPFSFWMTSTSTLTFLTAALPLISCMYFNAATFNNISSSPHMVMVTVWIWFAQFALPLKTSKAPSFYLAITNGIETPLPIPNIKHLLSFHNSLSPSQFASLLAITMCVSSAPTSDNTYDLINFYNSTISSCINNLAPIKTRTISFSHIAPIYSWIMSNESKETTTWMTAQKNWSHCSPSSLQSNPIQI